MGWNSWDCYGAGVTEDEFLANARVLADRLLPHGWDTAVIDIQWYEPLAVSHAYNKFTPLCMDELSRLIPAPNRFPSSRGGAGFAPIAEKVHAMGLRFGIHMLRGIPRQAAHSGALTAGGVPAREIAQPYSICPWNTDMYGVEDTPAGQAYYDSVISLYASWGVDFIKVDDICVTEYKPHDPYSAAKEIEMIRRAIDRCGRRIVLSLSPGPARLEDAEHLSRNAEMWRLSADFWDERSKLREAFDICEKWYPYVGDGCWPDLDMIPFGKLICHDPDRKRDSRFTPDDQKTLMTLWSVFRSPLFFGGSLTESGEDVFELLTNDDVLDLDQRSSGAAPVLSEGDLRIWRCVDADGREIRAIFDLSDADVVTDTTLPPGPATDLWSKETIADASRVLVPAHGCRLLRAEQSRSDDRQ